MENLSIPRHGEGIRADGIGQFDKRHLGVQPAGIFGDGIHGRLRVVAKEVKAVAEDQKGLDARANAMAGKLKVAHAIGLVMQPGPERAEVMDKILEEFVITRPGIKEDAGLILSERDHGPFIKHGAAVAGVHLLRAGFNPAENFFQCHAVEQSKSRAAAQGNLRGGEAFTAVTVNVAPWPDSASSNVAGRLISPKQGVSSRVARMEPTCRLPPMTLARWPRSQL